MSTEKTARAIADAMSKFGSDPESSLAALDPLYDEGVVFADPIQTLHGKNEFMAMNRRLMRRARELDFQVKETSWHLDHIFLTWEMRLVPKMGPALRFEGVTHLHLREGLVAEHRDYWDLLGSVAESLPIVGPIYRSLVARLG